MSLHENSDINPMIGVMLLKNLKNNRGPRKGVFILAISCVCIFNNPSNMVNLSRKNYTNTVSQPTHLLGLPSPNGWIMQFLALGHYRILMDLIKEFDDSSLPICLIWHSSL